LFITKVTLPVASLGKITVTVAFSPSFTSLTLTLISYPDILETLNEVLLLEDKYLASPL